MKHLILDLFHVTYVCESADVCFEKYERKGNQTSNGGMKGEAPEVDCDNS